MKDKSKGKTRTDRPSGRQASEQPEHANPSPPATESLHQGQGPDFQTQDPRIQERNEGIDKLERPQKKSQTKNGPHQQRSPSEDSGQKHVERMDTQNLETDGE